MIRFEIGSIFDSKCEALVNPVNCLGVSGAGLAKEFAKRFPFAQRGLEDLVDGGFIKIGTCGLVYLGDGNKCVVHFPTKDHWKNPSRLEWIDKGLADLLGLLEEQQIKTVAVPALGCGLGGLDWKEVRKLIHKHFLDTRIICEIYQPSMRSQP
jgi:O-acetyl-ADP-ribose deacetylase (regulator of RNase III)